MSLGVDEFIRILLDGFYLGGFLAFKICFHNGTLWSETIFRDSDQLINYDLSQTGINI